MAEPIRTCVGCQKKQPKGRLLRLVARDGGVVVDGSGSASGRGTYVCDAGCARKAVAKNAFARTLKAKAVAKDGFLDEVEAAMRAKGGG
jgi:predicted RNA-binding protein YlxR (DUF448 family)